MCDVCDERIADADDQRIVVKGPDGEPVRFLAVYELDREYGGPEEGGWWFTSHTLKHVEVVPKAPVWDQVFKTRIEKLKAEYPPDVANGYGLSSVAYQGGAYEVIVTDHGKVPWEYMPAVRPHYE